MRDTIAVILSVAALLLTSACSNVPAPYQPPTREFEFLAVYRQDGGLRTPIPIPASDDRVTVLELSAEPTLRERFEGDQRLLVPGEAHADDDAVRVRCRCRLHAQRAGGRWDFPAPDELFPTATRIVILDGSF